MHLEFSEEQEELRRSVRELLDRECPPAVVRDRVETGKPATALWQQMVDLGWPALTLAEDVDGLGLGPVEMVVVTEELGRHVAPVPWLPTVTQYAAVVREVGTPGQRASLLPPVATGTTVGTLAAAEDGVRAIPEALTTTARRDGDGWRLDGTKRWVWEASLADEIAVVARVDDGIGVFVVPAGETEVVPVRTVDGSREWATVRLDGAHVPAERALGEPGSGGVGLHRALQEATLAVAVETVGVCAALLERTVDYVKTRRQFGVPVGSFQAIKHKLVDSYVALERARSAAYFAAATLAEDDPRRDTAVPMAKAAAGAAQRRVAEDAVQSHGGIGYTWESDVHLFVKRAKANDAAFGTAGQQRRDLARLLDVGVGVAGRR